MPQDQVPPDESQCRAVFVELISPQGVKVACELSEPAFHRLLDRLGGGAVVDEAAAPKSELPAHPPATPDEGVTIGVVESDFGASDLLRLGDSRGA